MDIDAYGVEDPNGLGEVDVPGVFGYAGYRQSQPDALGESDFVTKKGVKRQVPVLDSETAS